MRKSSGGRIAGASTPRSERSNGHAAPLIVGIGASAGGLNAFKTFFENMPADSGMAFVLVQHLAPTHKSLLADLLGKVTAMPVIEAKDGSSVDANTVYVIPPDATLTLKERILRVTRPAPPLERRRPIDTFFSSLAEDQGENAVCIVLSGTGSDGTLGLKAIKEEGGLALAQADFDHMAMSGMPHSAAATGLVDEVLPVEDMPAKLVTYRSHLLTVAPHKDGDGTRRDTADHLAKITAILRTRVGHDFSKYKEKTLVRRIQRRMQVLQIDAVPEYIDRLRQEPQQVELLFRELLIGVTQFFRDPVAFVALQAAIPKLLEHKRPDDQLRIWVPACATGEEIYSIAILVKEAMAERADVPAVQIFGTDIDADAVSFARHGRYRRTAGLSSERLDRWFTKEGDEYCPVKAVRDLCVFSVHSIVKDPPFSKLDLISCRNLLIYLEAELQDRILQTFHYALNANGILFLGTSEGVTRSGQLFDVLDKKHRIYQRRNSDAALPGLSVVGLPHPVAPVRTPTRPRREDLIDRSAREALERFFPAYVVVDKQYQILQFSGGKVGSYLEPTSGAATLYLFDLLRKPLRSVVRAGLQTAQRTNQPAVQDAVPIGVEGRRRFVTVIATPIGDVGPETGLCVVAFQDATASATPTRPQIEASTAEEALSHELRTTRMQLQSTIDDLEATNEELKSASEEFQSVNEELQSSNEELETAKEEMQSINEELQTINAELLSKNAMLTHLNSDLKNLLDSTEIATIFLSEDLHIKSYTPRMMDIFALRDADRGRPITDIVTQLSYPDLQTPDLLSDVKTVLRQLSAIEREVRIVGKGMTFIMRIRPYRTVDNVIDGVVITFMDISERKKADTALRASEERLSALVQQATVGVAETNLDGRFVLVNETYCKIVGRSAEQLLGLQMQDVIHPDDRAHSGELFARLVAEGAPFEIENRFVRADGASIWVHSSVTMLRDQQGQSRGVLTINLDITRRKRAEDEAALLLAELDHRVKNTLAVISAVIAQTLKTSATPATFAAAMEGRIAAIARAHGLVNRTGAQGHLLLRELIEMELAPHDRLLHNIAIDGQDVTLMPKAGMALAMAIHELASNATKYGSLSTQGGRLTIAWESSGEPPNRTLHLIWTEAGGPPVKIPSRRGFGSNLIERVLTHELDAIVKLEFREVGLSCSIEIPLRAEVALMQFSNQEKKGAK